MIGTDVSQASYIGNGGTVNFSTVFPFFDNSHVTVEKKLSGGTTFTTLTGGVDYTLTGAAVIDNDGNRSAGNVAMVVAPAANDTLRITRNTPVVQPTHLKQQGPFFSATHEAIADYLTCVEQDLERRIAALEAGGAPVSLAASKVQDTFVVADPVESSFPRNVACAGTPSMVFVGRIEDLTDGTVIAYEGGALDLGSPVLNQFTVKYLPGLTPGHNTRVSYLVITL